MLSFMNLDKSFALSGSPSLPQGVIGCGGSLFQLWIWTSPSLLQAVLRKSNTTLGNPAFWTGKPSILRWTLQKKPWQIQHWEMDNPARTLDNPKKPWRIQRVERDPVWGPHEYISTSQQPFRATFSKGLISDYTDIYIYIYIHIWYAAGIYAGGCGLRPPFKQNQCAIKGPPDMHRAAASSECNKRPALIIKTAYARRGRRGNKQREWHQDGGMRSGRSCPWFLLLFIWIALWVWNSQNSA